MALEEKTFPRHRSLGEAILEISGDEKILDVGMSRANESAKRVRSFPA